MNLNAILPLRGDSSIGDLISGDRSGDLNWRPNVLCNKKMGSCKMLVVPFWDKSLVIPLKSMVPLPSPGREGCKCLYNHLFHQSSTINPIWCKWGIQRNFHDLSWPWGQEIMVIPRRRISAWGTPRTLSPSRIVESLLILHSGHHRFG